MKNLNILFVCIGNTCRSPMAESVMSHWIAQCGLDWKTDSAAIKTWNVGRLPEDRCVRVLAEHGLATTHVGRLIVPDDFYKFDYILCMDDSNVYDVNQLAEEVAPKHTAKIELLGSYIGHKEDEIIKDPYFSNGISSFRCVYYQINESCKRFIKAQTNYNVKI